jgi:hypothetical protein
MIEVVLVFTINLSLRYSNANHMMIGFEGKIN